MDVREFRNCMGRFATGVTVVTCKTEDGYHGFTVNSFTSVSLDPPLVLVSVDRKTKAMEHLKNNAFTINILNDKQDHVLFVGEVLNFEYTESDALTYFSGKFSSLSSKVQTV